MNRKKLAVAMMVAVVSSAHAADTAKNEASFDFEHYGIVASHRIDVHAADTGNKAPFEQQAAEGVIRAVLQTIARFYKSGRVCPPSDLIATKEHPLRISFSEGDGGSVAVSSTNNSVAVADKATISAKKVQFSIQDTDEAANKEREKNPNVFVMIGSARLLVKSGKWECSGSFTVDGKKVTLKSGDAEITGDDKPIKFSDGTQALIDGKEFLCKDGKWQPHASDTKGDSP